jgi:uncharacterized membrane protein YcaP (DUF421 family)
MEIVIRATIIFFFVWALTRILGKRTLAQLSPFELVLLIMLGDLVQSGVTQDDTSLTGSALAGGTLAFWVLAFSFLSWRYRRAESVIEGLPAVLIHDGEVIEDALRAERMPWSDLMEAARQQGVADLGEVKLAVLETNGLISFIKDRDSGESGGGPRRKLPKSGGGS